MRIFVIKFFRVTTAKKVPFCTSLPRKVDTPGKDLLSLPEKLAKGKQALARVHQALATTDIKLIVPLLLQQNLPAASGTPTAP